MADKLTEHDLDLISRARELGPALRASTSDRDRLAGWLLKELADLAERPAATEPAPAVSKTGSPVIDRITELSDAEQAYVARLVALTRPEAAEAALAGLAEYRRHHGAAANLLLGPETGDQP